MYIFNDLIHFIFILYLFLGLLIMQLTDEEQNAWIFIVSYVFYFILAFICWYFLWRSRLVLWRSRSLMCLQTYDAGLLPLPPLSSRGASHLLCGLLSWHSVRPLDIRRALHWPVALKDAALASGRCREEGTGEDVLRWRESRHISLGVHDTLRHVLAVLGVFVRLCGDECVSSSSSLFQGRAELLLTLSFGLVWWSD